MTLNVEQMRLIAIIICTLAMANALTVQESNSILDGVIQWLKSNSSSNIPVAVKNLQLEIFPPRDPGVPNRLLIRYDPPRYNVFITDMHIKSLGTIQRVESCTRSEITNDIECWIQVGSLLFDGKLDNGKTLEESIDFKIKLAAYSAATPDSNGNLWSLWCPWAPGAGENRPIFVKDISDTLKEYLKSKNLPVKGLHDHILGQFRRFFLDENILSMKFNQILKKQAVNA